MATGDVKAAAAALGAQLRAVRCLFDFSAHAAEAGSPAPLLGALGYVLLKFSKHVALLLAEQGVQVRCGGSAPVARRSNGAGAVAHLPARRLLSPLPLSLLQLHGKSDLRFVEGVIKFAREAWSIKSPVSAAQFLSEVGAGGAATQWVQRQRRSCGRQQRHCFTHSTHDCLPPCAGLC